MLVVCCRYASDKAEGEDILQEAFIKVFQNLKNFRGESTLGAWIKRIVVNSALNHLRAGQHWQNQSDIEDQANFISDEGLSLDGIHFQDLLNMIQKLPKGCQTVFNLYAIEGYQHHEIAEMLGISEGTSKSQYSRAKQLLQAAVALDYYPRKKIS